MGELLVLSLFLLKQNQLQHHSSKRETAGVLKFLADKELLAPSLGIGVGACVTVGLPILAGAIGVTPVGWVGAAIAGLGLGINAVLSSSGVYEAVENYFKSEPSEPQPSSQGSNSPTSNITNEPRKNNELPLDIVPFNLEGLVQQTSFSFKGCSFYLLSYQEGSMSFKTFCSEGTSPQECIKKL